MGIVYLVVIAVQIQGYLSYTRKAAAKQQQEEALDHGLGYSHQ